jgi:hypothetical protein
LVAEALGELREKDLLDAEPQPVQSAVPGESRRQAIGRVARYGAAAATGSMIVSATAATPAMASSEEAQRCCQCSVNAVDCGCTLGTEAECKAICEQNCAPGWKLAKTALRKCEKGSCVA